MKKTLSFEKYLKEQLRNSVFKKAYNDLEPEFEIIRSVIRARIEKKITQKEFARRMNTTQSAISRFELGNSNPTVSFLKKAAAALESKLIISIK